MRRQFIRVVAPLFVFLVAAASFVPQVRGDELLNFNVGDGTWTWTLAQDATPDFGSVATGDFTFSKVPVFVTFAGMVQTFDLHFFRLTGTPDTTNFQMICDPFSIRIDNPSLTCDYFNWIQIEGDTGIWTSGPDNNPIFVPGVYNGPNGLIISETPEPSTFALLLISFATLSLLAVGVRPRCPS